MGGTHWYCCSQGNMVIVVNKTTINELQLLRGPSGIKYIFKYIQYRYHYKVSPMMMMSLSPDDEIYPS